MNGNHKLRRIITGKRLNISLGITYSVSIRTALPTQAYLIANPEHPRGENNATINQKRRQCRCACDLLDDQQNDNTR
jgi:hypothetical protein